MKLNSEIPDETVGTNLQVMCFCLPEKKRIKNDIKNTKKYIHIASHSDRKFLHDVNNSRKVDLSILSLVKKFANQFFLLKFLVYKVY